jgi:hypothetical protein
MPEEQVDNSFLDNTDLTGVEVGPPMLGDCLVHCTTGDVRIVANGDKRRLVIPLTLEEPAVDVDNKPVNPGVRLTDSIQLTPSGGLTQEIINEKLARFQVAVKREKRPGPFGPIDQYQGKTVLVKFGKRDDKREDHKGEVQQTFRYLAAKD